MAEATPQAPSPQAGKAPPAAPEAGKTPAQGPGQVPARPVRPVAALPPNLLQPAESAYQRWAIVVSVDTPYEHLSRPEYWAHVRPKIRQGAIIEARAEDDSWYAEFYVRTSNERGVSVRELARHAFADEDELLPLPEAFKIEWRGALKKHRVVRLSDSVEVGAGFDTRAQAEQHARELARSYRL